jgi:hypothetical protein
MIPIERLVEESIEEEMADRTGPESDLSALIHSLGQVWRDLPPDTRSFLIEQAQSIVRQMWRDPKGALTQIGRLTRLLIGQGQPPLLAAKKAVRRVAIRHKPLAKLAKGKKRPVFKRRPGGAPKRFEAGWT